MAKFTDLPNEVLALIFRNFLSSSLTNHSHLCEWNVSFTDFANRANLARLARVSKAMYARAMPLLFEQLLGGEDIRVLSANESAMQTAHRFCPNVVYARVTTSMQQSSVQDLFVKEFLSSCTALKHLKLRLTGPISCPSEYISILAGNMELRSLSIGLHLSHSAPEALYQLCSIQRLVGLEIAIGKSTHRGMPTIKMPQLKVLRIAGSHDYWTSAAFMHMADPHKLEEASIHVFNPPLTSENSVYPIFGQDEWSKLERLTIFIEAGVNLDQLDWSLCPALRYLTFSPNVHDYVDYDSILSRVSPTVAHLAINDVNEEELEAILELALHEGRLGPGLRSLHLGLDHLRNEGVSSISVTEEVLQLARDAVQALQHRGVELRPATLVEELAAIGHYPEEDDD